MPDIEREPLKELLRPKAIDSNGVGGTSTGNMCGGGGG